MAGFASLAAAFAAVKAYDFDARIDSDLANVMSLGLPHVGASAPTVFYPGKVWLDTTSGVVRLKICSAVTSGSATWVSMDPAPAAVGATAPTDVYVGKLWYDSTSGQADLKICTAVNEAGEATWTVCFTAAG